MTQRNVLIIEDHPLVAQATQSLLRSLGIGDITVCHSAGDALAHLRASGGWFRVLVDLCVPGAQGLSLVRELCEYGLSHCSAVITASDNPLWIGEVRAMGLLGYVLKTASVEDFNLALQQILRGTRHFATQSLRQATGLLTRRQTEILRLLSIGLSTKEIARTLTLSPGTVDNHVCALTSALGANDRTHAVAIGLRLGYVNIIES